MPHLEIHEGLLPQRKGVVCKGISFEGEVTINFIRTPRIEIRMFQRGVSYSVDRVA
jgi:hypothetical protein